MVPVILLQSPYNILRLFTTVKWATVFCNLYHFSSQYNYIKVTVHINTDQNFEIEIFAEYIYTLNELLVKKMLFYMSNRRIFREVIVYILPH